MTRARWISVLVLATSACGDERASSVDGGDARSDSMQTDTNLDCPRMPAAPDRPRQLVVARPLDSNNAPANRYEVLQVGSDGLVYQSFPPRFFEMSGRATKGVIRFTPDSKIGFIPFDDGKIGVFSIDPMGAIAQVHYAWEGMGIASALEVSPDGKTLYIVDRRDRANGGGIYAATIACDGTLTDRGLVAAGSPMGLAFRGGNLATSVVAANDLLDQTAAGDEIHLVDLSTTPPTRIAGDDVFDGANPTMTRFAMSANVAFVGDATRLSIATVTDTTVTPETVMTDIAVLNGLATSPFDDSALVLIQPDNLSRRMFRIHEENGAWTRSPLTGDNGPAPAEIVTIERGALRGFFYVAESTIVHGYKWSTMHPGLIVSITAEVFPPYGAEQTTGALGVTP